MKKKPIKKLIILLTAAIAITSDLQAKTSNEKVKDQMPDTGKTALIIIDIQNDYFPGGAMELVSSVETAQKANKMLSYFRKQKKPVIHIKHIALQKGATFFLPNTEGAEINKMVAPLITEKTIVKNYPNSFRDTELLAYLKKHNITNLVFCGMMTDVCVDATVRAAMDYGFTNTIISDAVTTRDRSLNGKKIRAKQVTSAYLAGLNALDGLYAQVTTSKQYLTRK